MHPAGASDAALHHLLDWIARTIDADGVQWIGSVRALRGAEAEKDPFRGWRLRTRQAWREDSEAVQRRHAAYYASNHFGKRTASYRDPEAHLEKEDAHIGMTSRAIVAGAGKFRVHRMRDGWIDFERFRHTLHYKLYYEDAGITDRIWISVPVDEDLESTLLVDRHAREDGVEHFTLQEATLAGDAFRGAVDLHRRLLLETGLLTGEKPLSAAERAVLRGLLSSRSEKEIATVTKQSAHTVHAYVKTLYVRFGVQSRQGLMARWLGHS